MSWVTCPLQMSNKCYQRSAQADFSIHPQILAYSMKYTARQSVLLLGMFVQGKQHQCQSSLPFSETLSAISYQWHAIGVSAYSQGQYLQSGVATTIGDSTYSRRQYLQSEVVPAVGCSTYSQRQYLQSGVVPTVEGVTVRCSTYSRGGVVPTVEGQYLQQWWATCGPQVAHQLQKCDTLVPFRIFSLGQDFAFS